MKEALFNGCLCKTLDKEEIKMSKKFFQIIAFTGFSFGMLGGVNATETESQMSATRMPPGECREHCREECSEHEHQPRDRDICERRCFEHCHLE